MVSDKKIFKVFLMNHNSLNKLGRRSRKEHSCQVVLKSVHWCLTRRFLKFSIQIYKDNKPRPLEAMFLDESCLHEQSRYRVTKATFLPNNIGISQMVSDKKTFLYSFLYRHIGKIRHAPWRPCFFTYQEDLNNLGTRSPSNIPAKLHRNRCRGF